MSSTDQVFIPRAIQYHLYLKSTMPQSTQDWQFLGHDRHAIANRQEPKTTNHLRLNSMQCLH